MEEVDAGYEFYVLMLSRSDGKIYSDLAKTNHRIYFSEEEAKADLINYPHYQVVKMVGYKC